jgi:hypothetical protein
MCVILGAAGTAAAGIWPFTQAPKYQLTVEHGTGTGLYKAGTKVTITADLPPSPQIFARWTTLNGEDDRLLTPAGSPLAMIVTMPARNLNVFAIWVAPTRPVPRN